MTTRAPATADNLYDVPEHRKAEIIDGEVTIMSPTGFRPGRAAARILASLLQFEHHVPHGYALGDNVGFVVDLPSRKSFSPDAAFYIGPEMGGKFVQGGPVFAIEVRSEGDYGLGAERAIMCKRADYFAADTQVVWDVDVLRDGVVRVYRASDPDTMIVYGRGEFAEAEPVLPGWRYEVDDLFR